MSGDFERLERGSSVLYGASSGIWVMILFAKPTTADMLLARPALAGMTRRSPAGFPTLTWVLPQAGLSMDQEARQAAADVTNEYAKQILAQATLIEGSGFQAATVRAIIAGLDLMSRSSSPKKVFGELGPAIEWCASRAPASTARAIVPAAVTKTLALTRESLERPS